MPKPKPPPPLKPQSSVPKTLASGEILPLSIAATREGEREGKKQRKARRGEEEGEGKEEVRHRHASKEEPPTKDAARRSITEPAPRSPASTILLGTAQHRVVTAAPRHRSRPFFLNLTGRHTLHLAAVEP
jgi:hypothetical protein